MDLEVVGRHALFFDDDAAAASVNSGDTLVDWNSLQIDRYDVRHLLSTPLPPRRRRSPQIYSQNPDFAFESELDQERYWDFPSPSDEPEGKEAEKSGNPSNYRAVAFSYGNTNPSVDRENAEGELESSLFRPPFAVPESLLQSLPPTEKIHQIIARTATFVSKHGGQSEIVLRVKQGDNPTFGFLMPNHQFHPYFRFLVDHQELLQSDIDGKGEPEDQMGTAAQSCSALGGALSLLGSVYGSGDDDDPAMDGGHDAMDISPEETISDTSRKDTYSVGNGSCSSNGAEKDKTDARKKHRSTSNQDKVPVLKKNPSIAGSKSVASSYKKQIDESCSFSFPMEKSKDTLMLNPPSDLKRLIDKIVELIVKNGKQFESTFREQNSKHGRFPFLLPSNQYHPYYLKVLQRAEESKFGPRSSFHRREDFMARIMDKRSLISKDNDALASGSVCYDLPFESDRKEKFKMVIGKAKKDMNDPPSKASQPEYGISVDAAAAAAILQAATRGIRNPDLGIISCNSVNGSSYEGSNSKRHGDECNSMLPVAHTGKGVVIGTAAKEALSEEHLSREQKLKAERLKRAKMFVAKLKTGSGPCTAEPPSRTSSAEPINSVGFQTGAEVDHIEKAKGGSCALVDSCIPDETEDIRRKNFGDEYSERRLRRKYRSRSKIHEVDNGSGDEEDVAESPIKKKRRSHAPEGKGRIEKDEEEEEEEETKKHHNKRKHRSHRDGHKHRKESHGRRSKHESSSDSDHEYAHKHTYKHKKHSHKSYKHKRSATYEHGDISKYEHLGKEDLEEGEISPKLSDQSRVSGIGGGKCGTSLDNVSAVPNASSQSFETTEVSDDLRAKIRAMLMATR